MRLIDYNGKTSRKATLANPSNAELIPRKDADGKKIAQAAKETILSVNGIGSDFPDYHLLANNCDINARKWMRAGGVTMSTGGDPIPNDVYIYNVSKIDDKALGYENAIFGDLNYIWTKLHPQLYFVPTDETKCTTCN